MLTIRELAAEKDALDSELDPIQRRTLARIWDGLLAKSYQNQQAMSAAIERLEEALSKAQTGEQ